MAAGLLTVGVSAPTVALVLRIDDARDNNLALYATVAAVVLLAGVLHFGGRHILERLEE